MQQVLTFIQTFSLIGGIGYFGLGIVQMVMIAMGKADPRKTDGVRNFLAGCILLIITLLMMKFL